MSVRPNAKSSFRFSFVRSFSMSTAINSFWHVMFARAFSKKVAMFPVFQRAVTREKSSQSCSSFWMITVFLSFSSLPFFFSPYSFLITFHCRDVYWLFVKCKRIVLLFFFPFLFSPCSPSSDYFNRSCFFFPFPLCNCYRFLCLWTKR